MIDANGHFPSSDDLILGAAKKSITNKAGDLVCPDHKKKATLTITGRTLRDMSVNINACCDKFNAVVSKRIRG
jgi:hypothetical protein